tara:strand:- start:220 stop:780 length:561 start_codon:yes stop_codon:yes gene_type:complete
METKALSNILERNSPRQLVEPHPSADQMKLVYEAALRAPDHGWIRPSRFIEVSGDGLEKLSNIFQEFARNHLEDVSDDILEKYKQAPFRAPMIIILVSTIKEHPKVPALEQMFSTAAAGQNILLALNALGFGGIWRTGKFALNKKIGSFLGLDDNQEVLGYLYIGTPAGDNKKIPQLDLEDFVKKL